MPNAMDRISLFITPNLTMPAQHAHFITVFSEVNQLNHEECLVSRKRLIIADKTIKVINDSLVSIILSNPSRCLRA